MYVFGEGNPKEVALGAEGIKQYLSGVAQLNDYGDYGYITPEVEILLKKALSDPNWEPFLMTCSSYFSGELDKNPNNPLPITYQKLIQPGFLDITHFLIIDPVTGRKELSPLLNHLRIEYLIPHIARWSDGEESDTNQPQENCLYRYGSSILNSVNATINSYAAFQTDS